MLFVVSNYIYNKTTATETTTTITIGKHSKNTNFCQDLKPRLHQGGNMLPGNMSATSNMLPGNMLPGNPATCCLMQTRL